MTYTIKGLTKSTITFNKFNLILRGNDGEESISRTIEITTPDQQKEIDSLVNDGYIQVVANDTNVGYIDTNSTLKNKNLLPKEEEPKIFTEDKTSDKTSEKAIEDVVIKNKKQTKTSKNTKKIKRALVTESEDGEPIVMTSDGYKVAKVHKTIYSDIEDSPQVLESLKAAEKLDNPEDVEENNVKEQEVSEQDKMGSDAVIAIGNNKFEKKAMKKSIVNETEEIDKVSPFIDINESNEAVKDFKKKEEEKIKAAFIDPPDETDETSDAFVEI